jgi:hypothetical protein
VHKIDAWEILSYHFITDQVPLAAQFPHVCLDSLAMQWLHSALAGNTFLFLQVVSHIVSSLDENFINVIYLT